MRRLAFITIFGLLGCAHHATDREVLAPYLQAQKRERLIAVIKANETDTDALFRLTYKLSSEEARRMMAPQDAVYYRPISRNSYDMSDWVAAMGVRESRGTTARFDRDKRTLIFVYPGDSASLIENLLRPLYPIEYEKI